MTSVGFVGIGTMGAPMARHLIAAGHDVRLFDVHAPAAEAVGAAGGTVAGSAAEAADGTEAVFLSLPGPAEIVAAVIGEDGVLSASAVPDHVVDLSTNAVDVVATLRAAGADHGVAFLDAPVSGGVVAADAGTLTVMIGGTDDEVAAVTPLLESFARTVLHVGPSGSGAIAKLVNNQIFLAAGTVLQEAYVTGAALGMEPADVHRIVSASSGGPYAKLAPLMLGRTFDDVIFRMDIAAKDLELAAASAEAAGADVPLTRAAIGVYQSAIEAGLGDKAFHATLLELESRAGVELAKLERPPRREG